MGKIKAIVKWVRRARPDRGVWLLVFLLIFGFLTDMIQTGRMAVVKGEEFRALAEANQLSDTSLKAVRGTIYDSNMNVLAQSASLWRVYVNPAMARGDKDEDVRLRVEISAGLSEILGIPADEIMQKLQKSDSNNETIARQVEKSVMEKVASFRAEEFRASGEKKLGFSAVIGITGDIKRYYPNSTLASALIGFTGIDDQGLSGLEAEYDDILTGVDGRLITAKDGYQNQLADGYSVTYDTQQGTSLVLTIDEMVQYTLENALRQSMIDTSASYAYGIVMNVKTGAVLGMVSLPDYNLNDPYTVPDEDVQAEYDKIAASMETASEEKQAEYNAMTQEDKWIQAKKNVRNAYWRNRAVSDTYEPGSVFKCVTLSAAIEEGLVTDDFYFDCTGTIHVADRDYHCWKSGGHGSEHLEDLLKNSCNPFAITLARMVGSETYYKYFEAFGFTETTGIDLLGEAVPNAPATYHSRSNFGIAQLASYSFGQTFQVSPIQMITAISAIANGGKLMTPYVVAKELDEEGNTVNVTEPKVRRQVISESTAKHVATLMEKVVSEGTGKNAYVAGYRVAGKTGTSEKLQNKGQYVASFVGFAPADDPQVAVLIAIDEPDPNNDHGGGVIAAPVAGEVLGTILPHLNIEASYNDSEQQNIVKTPNVVGESAESAASDLRSQGFTVKVRGDGDTVLVQTPAEGNQISKNGVIILYTEEDYDASMVTVPDFTGCSIYEAYELAADTGLNIRISGNSLSGSGVSAYRQSIEAGHGVTAGTMITVYFRTSVGVADSSN